MPVQGVLCTIYLGDRVVQLKCTICVAVIVSLIASTHRDISLNHIRSPSVLPLVHQIPLWCCQLCLGVIILVYWLVVYQLV